MTSDDLRGKAKPETKLVEGQTTAPQTVTAEWAGLRDRTGILNQDVHDLHSEASRGHRRALMQLLETQTQSVAKRDVIRLLRELSDRGFSWRDIARLVGVSVPALRKWRQGEQPSGENRKAIARLVALAETLEQQFLVKDMASWMEIPIHDHHDDYTPISCLDLYAAGRADLILDYGANRITDPHELLDDFDPYWRKKFAAEWEVFDVGDGSFGVRQRGNR